MEYLTLFAKQTSFFDLALPERKYTEAEGKYHTGGRVSPLPLTAQADGFCAALLALLAVEADSPAAPRIRTGPTEDARPLELHYGVSGPEAARVLAEVSLDAYGYRVEGGRIFVYGHTAEELAAAGFVLCAARTARGNRYATLRCEDALADVWYTTDGYLRITAVSADRGFHLPAQERAPYATACETGLFLVGGYEPIPDRGEMCLFFRLADGRFVVIDSGWDKRVSEKLVRELRRQAPDPDRVVIACWIFTHGHADHTYGFYGLCEGWERYRWWITVESFLCNLPGEEQAFVPWQMVIEGARMREYIHGLFPSARRYKAHPGWILDFANLRAEVLATHESYVYAEYPNYQNACNTLLRLEIEGQVVMIPGDTSNYDHDKLVELYGDYLSCDILQAPHHGGRGSGTVESARAYAPRVVLFCNTSLGHEYSAGFMMKLDYNQALVDRAQNPRFEEYVVAENHVTYFPLPYRAGNAERVYTYSEEDL